MPTTRFSFDPQSSMEGTLATDREEKVCKTTLQVVPYTYPHLTEVYSDC
jgi:hypothetical protein